MAVSPGSCLNQVHKSLPPHTGWLHVFGSLSWLLFLSQTITGIMLLIYYRPTPEAAHKSIQYITAEVNFGWLYRQVHASTRSTKACPRTPDGCTCSEACRCCCSSARRSPGSCC